MEASLTLLTLTVGEVALQSRKRQVTEDHRNRLRPFALAFEPQNKTETHSHQHATIHYFLYHQDFQLSC